MNKILAKLAVSRLPRRKKKPIIVKRLPPISDEELEINFKLLEGKLNTQIRKPF